eukprot:gene28452-31597_t
MFINNTTSKPGLDTFQHMFINNTPNKPGLDSSSSLLQQMLIKQEQLLVNNAGTGAKSDMPAGYMYGGGSPSGTMSPISLEGGAKSDLSAGFMYGGESPSGTISPIFLGKLQDLFSNSEGGTKSDMPAGYMYGGGSPSGMMSPITLGGGSNNNSGGFVKVQRSRGQHRQRQKDRTATLEKE